MSRKHSKKAEPPDYQETLTLETCLQEKLAAASDLAALLQHQINNPLAVILGNVQFLLYKEVDMDETIRKRLIIVEKAAIKVAETSRRLSAICAVAKDRKLAEVK